MNVLVIANPVAGAGRGRRRAERLAALLEGRGHAVALHVTTGAGDALRHLRALGDEVKTFERIVAAGGDGTLSEVVNGLADPARIPLAQLPLGTANSLARELRLPRRPEALVPLLESGSVRRVDLGRVDGRRFLMNASCGFDAMVTESIRRRRTGALGFRGYAAPILGTLRHYREPQLRLRLDGGEEWPAALVIASNLRNYGGLFRVTDRARCDSGQLDVCAFRRARRGDLVRYAAAALAGRVSRLRDVVYRGVQRVEIASPEPVAVQADGDYLGTTPVRLEIEPRQVPIVAGPA